MALRFVLVAIFLCYAARASAHGPAPAVSALLLLEGEQATLVGLTRGLAHRAEDGFRFVCPETWGGDATALRAGIPHGPVVVASEKLYVVESDGRVAPHTQQVGEGVALASNGDALFGIFKRGEQRALWRIGERASELVRSLEEPFGALAATDSELSLLSWADEVLLLQTFSLSGEPAARVTWRAPNDVAYAELRTAADQLYVLIWGSAAPWVTLGRVTERGYEQLAEAQSEIAGPLALGSRTYIARDGVFAALEGSSPPIGRNEYVSCLGSYVGLSYACVHGDLLRVDQAGLGAPLFELASLREPNYQGLPDPARRDCIARWVDLQDHLANAAATNVAPAASAPDRAVSAAPDAAVDGQAPEANAAHPAGCALGSASAGTGWLSAVVLAVCAARGRRSPLLSSAR